MDERILRCARRAAAEVGIDRCSLSLISDTAGVGKATIYLRWPDRWAVMAAAVDDLAGPPDPADYDGLVAAVWAAHRALVSGADAPFLRAVLDASARQPQLGEALERAVLGPWRRFLEDVARNREAGAGIGPAHAREVADLVKAQLVVAMVRGGHGDDRSPLADWTRHLDRRPATQGRSDLGTSRDWR